MCGRVASARPTCVGCFLGLKTGVCGLCVGGAAATDLMQCVCDQSQRPRPKTQDTVLQASSHQITPSSKRSNTCSLDGLPPHSPSPHNPAHPCMVRVLVASCLQPLPICPSLPAALSPSPMLPPLPPPPRFLADCQVRVDRGGPFRERAEPEEQCDVPLYEETAEPGGGAAGEAK